MHSIEFTTTNPLDPATILELSVSQSNQSELPLNSVCFRFQCLSQVYCKSLQVLLLPYFQQFNPNIKANDCLIEVGFALERPIISDELSLQVRLGFSIERLKEDYLQELVEAVYLKLECDNLEEVIELMGMSDVRIESSKIVMTMDPEDFPNEALEYFHKRFAGLYRYFEVLSAIKPFLKNPAVEINGNLGKVKLCANLKF